MFLKRIKPKEGKKRTYWALVKSIRTARGPRHEVVSYLGELQTGEKSELANLARIVNKRPIPGMPLFDTPETTEPVPETIEVRVRGARVERTRDFGNVGTPKATLRSYEQALLEQDWTQVEEGIEVKLRPGPEGIETFILCRSAARREKEKAMHERFEKRIEEGLQSLQRRLDKATKKPNRSQVERQIGRLLGRNSRAAGLFDIKVSEAKQDGTDGFLKMTWTKKDAWREWASLSEGCYLLRTNLIDWTAEDLWKTYIQLTQAEAAF